ncbi:MAG: hypothetical protein WKF57_03560 [Nakamurella sp.]
MSRLSKAIRDHRVSNRNRRELDRALQVATPSMRNELLVLAQRQGITR